MTAAMSVHGRQLPSSVAAVIGALVGERQQQPGDALLIGTGKGLEAGHGIGNQGRHI